MVAYTSSKVSARLVHVVEADGVADDHGRGVAGGAHVPHRRRRDRVADLLGDPAFVARTESDDGDARQGRGGHDPSGSTRPLSRFQTP
jgi:hypothetical protein